MPVRTDTPLLVIALVEARFHTGTHELYQVPVGLRPESEGWSDGVIGTVDGWTVYDALKDPEHGRAVLELMREGREIDTQGDSFFFAFARANAALGAAVAAQRALAEHDWAEGAQVRVRMGLHTGEAEERDGDYYGTSVNRAARIMAIANSGQILISDSAAAVSREKVFDVFPSIA